MSRGIKNVFQKKGSQRRPIVDDDGKLYGRDKTTPKTRQAKEEIKADTEAKATRAKGKDVKQEIKKDAKRRGDKSVKQERDTRPKKNTFSKLDQKEMDYNALLIGVKRRLILKQTKGEPATYQGVDYSDVLSKRKNIKSQVTKKQTGGKLKEKLPITNSKSKKNKTHKAKSRPIPVKGLPRPIPVKGLRGMGKALRGGGKVMKR